VSLYPIIYSEAHTTHMDPQITNIALHYKNISLLSRTSLRTKAES